MNSVIYSAYDDALVVTIFFILLLNVQLRAYDEIE